MTDLRKEVKRRTVANCEFVRRRLIVALMPGDVIGFREEGRRSWYTAPLGRVFIQVVRWNAEAERSRVRAERKARRARA